jgi:hypothetical protein
VQRGYRFKLHRLRPGWSSGTHMAGAQKCPMAFWRYPGEDNHIGEKRG